MLIAPHELIDDHGAQCQQLRALPALHWPLDLPFTDVFLQPSAGVDGLRAPLVKPFPDLHAPSAMRIWASPGGHHVTGTPVALLPPLGVMVVGIAQHQAHIARQLRQQPGSPLMIAPMRHGQLSGQGDPARPHGHGQRPLPALPPAVPPRLAPARFGLNRAGGDEALLPMLCVPPAPARRQRGASDRDGAPLPGPRRPQGDQGPPPDPHQPRHAWRQGRQAALPGAAGGPAPRLIPPRVHRAWPGIRLVEQRQQRRRRLETAGHHAD